MLLLFMYGIKKMSCKIFFLNLFESFFGFASELREAVGREGVDIREGEGFQ